MTIEPRGSLAMVDWLIAGGYAAVLVIVGLWAARRRPRPEEYFLASRASRWPLIGLALFASNISSTALVGLAGAGYATGLSVYDYEWTGTVMLVLYCVFLLPMVLRSRVYTMPEYLERRYDSRARLYFAVLTLILNVFVDCAGALYSGSVVCRLLAPNVQVWLIVLALAGAAGVYTAIGGLRAVIYTESLQTVVLLAGASAIAFGALWRVGGWHALVSNIAPGRLSLVRPVGDPTVPWPGLAFGIPLLGFYYWCTNQGIVQRVLSAKNVDHGRGGALLAGILKLPGLFLMVLPGTCALLLFPHLPRADQVYPALILGLLPAGLAGLVVAGFVAATMAAVASTLNAASTLVTMDIAKRLWPALSDRHIVRIGQYSAAAILLVAALWAPQLQRFPSLWQYLQSMLAYSVPPIVALFLVGMFWRGANAAGAAATLALGSLLGLIFGVATFRAHGWSLHFLYATTLLTLLDCAILVIVSLWRRKPDTAAIEPLIWTRHVLREEALRLRGIPWWRDYRVQGLTLLGMTALIVVAFR